jgi:phage baseplate assembly protein V
MTPRATGGVSCKTGVVAEAKPGFARVRFDDLDRLTTAWLPLIHPKTFLDKVVWTLDVGEHVCCLLDAYMEDGCIVGAIYSGADAPPTASGDKALARFSDGTAIEYDRAAHRLVIHCAGDIEIVAHGHLKLAGARIDLNEG